MNIVSLLTGGIVESVGKIADDLFTSDEERLKMDLESKKIDAGLAVAQMKVNQQEASHKSVFVAGWRPGMGWVGVAAMAYQFLLQPMLVWAWRFMQAAQLVPQDLSPPPPADAGPLFAVVTGMLGLGSMRSFDKTRATQTDSIRAAK